MTDDFDLDQLTNAMHGASPAPDDAKRDANIALSEQNFEKLHAARQGSSDAARLIPDRPEKLGFIAGVRNMLKSLSTKSALAATTSIATLGLALFVVLPNVNMQDLRTAQKSDPQPVAITQDIKSDEGTAIAHAEVTEELLPESAPVIEIAPEAAIGGLMIASDQMASSPPVARSSGAISGYTEIPSPVQPDIMPTPEANTESFANEEPHALKITSEEPVSTFSIDVDTASYAIVRSSLTQGYLPQPGAVRAEEMINYFPYDYTPPMDDLPFASTVTVTPTPWNDGTQLVHIAIQGDMPAIDDRPPLNLVFLIDTSGSMNNPDKLPLLVQSFRLMLSELRPEDSVAIITYAGSAGQVLAPTPASERATILNALTNLRAGGSTAGQAGLQQAYQVAEGMTEDGEISRVILATDGDFNVGLSSPEALKTYIADKRESGTYLSVLGFGRGNLDDATMQALAQNGNGTASYIDTLQEAQKVLVDQMSGALFPIANDVKIQVEFNPTEIAEYRLIGYETRSLRREDFNNDTVDAGEIGAGHSVTAIYEVTPVGSDAVLNDPLRYGAETTAPNSDELGFLRLRYKNPGEDTSNLIETPITATTTTASTDVNFAVSIAGFAQLLQGTDYLGSWDYDQAIALANANKGEDNFGYRAQAVTLMRLAQSLSQN